jgi:hypothetical protein
MLTKETCSETLLHSMKAGLIRKHVMATCDDTSCSPYAMFASARCCGAPLERRLLFQKLDKVPARWKLLPKYYMHIFLLYSNAS